MNALFLKRLATEKVRNNYLELKLYTFSDGFDMFISHYDIKVVLEQVIPINLILEVIWKLRLHV